MCRYENTKNTKNTKKNKIPWDYNNPLNMNMDKLWNKAVLDSEIIQEIESAKHRDPGFNINQPDMYGLTLLLRAVQYDRKELVEYILADPDINVNYGDIHYRLYPINTGLRMATYDWISISILKLFLCHKDIDVNKQKDNEWTVLHEACFKNNKKYVRELLLDARIDVLIYDCQGRTAQNTVRRDGHGIANMLKRVLRTSLLRIPNASLCRDIIRMIIEEYI